MSGLKDMTAAAEPADPAIFEPKTALPAPQVPGGRRELLGLSRDELTAELAELGAPPFRARQLWQWIYGRGATSFYPTLVNRLDVPTSGIVLIALTREVHHAMQAMSAAHLIEKEYVALVEGRLAEGEGLIDLPIGPSRESPVSLKMACRADGKPSRTRYEVIERFAAHTLLRAFPVTGRQHQVRVHMAAVGHPVVGDLLYRDETLFLSGSAGRHCLHARRVAFSHPQSGQPVGIEADIPEDFAALLRAVTGPHAQP